MAAVPSVTSMGGRRRGTVRTFTRCVVATAAAALLVPACTGPAPEDPEVAGLVLDRADGLVTDEDPATTPPEEPPAPTDPDPGDDAPEDLGIAPLTVLRSGPTAVGAVWLAAAGTWVGLDGQTLELGEVRPHLHLDAEVEVVDAGSARPTGCVVRVVAPDDAELQVDGTLVASVVIDDPDGGSLRTPVDPITLELLLPPGDTWELGLVLDAATELAVAPRPDATIRCEGRFDRS